MIGYPLAVHLIAKDQVRFAARFRLEVIEIIRPGPKFVFHRLGPCLDPEAALIGEGLVASQFGEAFGDAQLRQVQAPDVCGHPRPTRFGRFEPFGPLIARRHGDDPIAERIGRPQIDCPDGALLEEWVEFLDEARGLVAVAQVIAIQHGGE